MIPIQNIYYMLSYAFRELSEGDYTKLGSENFDNALELLAAILIIAVRKQIKRGIIKNYEDKTSELNNVRGKINLTSSIKNQSLLNHRLVCNYDEYTSNTYFNSILKTTLELLLKSDITMKRKREIKKLLIHFKNIDSLDPNRINWNQKFTRNNTNYRFLIYICNLIIDGLIQNQNGNSAKLRNFIDDQKMHRLYEKFLLEYFRKEFPELKVSSKQIKWALDDSYSSFLPIMQSDVCIENNDKTLIIDAKYYHSTMQSYYGTHTVHSNNIYQIFTYVKNQKANTNSEVSGMLLYARTDQEFQPDETYRIDGNEISVKTLDLNCDFEEIKSQLDKIIRDNF